MTSADTQDPGTAGVRRVMGWFGRKRPAPAPVVSTEDSGNSGGKYASEYATPTSAEVNAMPKPISFQPVEMPDDELAELMANFEGAASKPAAHVVVLPPTEPEIIAAWLARARGEYEPWVRRHAHALIDELIDRARRGAAS